MFVVSLKSSKLKIALFITFVVAVCIFSLVIFGKDYSSSVVAEGGISLRASNEKQRTAFLSQLGWDFEIEPAQVREVTIPEEFDEVYEKYNELQKEQSFDLEKYKGQKVKKWTFDINNFPGHEGEDGLVQANLLIYKGNVIGGDITVRGKVPEMYTLYKDD